MTEPELGADEHIVFLYRDDDTEIWHGLPVELDAGRAVVRMEHFSPGFFGRFRLDGSFGDALMRFLGQSYATPDCLGKTVVHENREYSAESSNEALRACVTLRDDAVHVEAHSNSGLVWRVRGVPGELAPGIEAAPGTLSGEVVKMVHRVDPRRTEGEMVLPSGGRISLEIAEGVQHTYADLQADPALGLLAPLLAGIQMLVGAAGGGAATDALETAQCSAGAITLPAVDADLVPWLAGITPALIDCLVTQVEDSHPLSGAVSMALGMVSSLPGVFASQVVGAVNEVRGQNDARIVVSSAHAPLLLSPAAIGEVPLGIRPADQLRGLTAVLGEPDEVVECEGCFLAGPDTRHYGVRWRNLYVYGEGPAATLVLDAWVLGPAATGGQTPVQAPFGTYLGMSTAEALSAVPGSTHVEDTMFGEFVLGPDQLSWTIHDGVVSWISGGSGYSCE